MAAAEFRKGFIEPPLIKQLQNILKQYPDDGQILKELIQNAEDAGAKTIKFLYDHNEYPHDDGTLCHKGLAEYQGPALYAYNDAIFSDDDWKGIRMIQDSVKSKDPMKVGRFGLGFKSVFHMTDLPGIISGNQVAFLDPRQWFFKNKTPVEQNGVKWEDETKTSSYAWNLSTDLLNNYPNQFKPFMHDIFSTNEKTFESGYFKGTVLRFPLRKNKSEISETIYNDDEKISNLMELLEKEGHLLLLFLKHLERIEFLELFPGKEHPELKLSVSCSNGNKALEHRHEFVKRIKLIQQTESELPEAEFCNYLLETKLDNINIDSSETKRWAVTQYYGCGDAQNEITVLANKSQNIPLVGVALPVSSNDNVTEKLTPSGSVFCFLPMPLGSDNETGLNVHVNGYFAVDQNRRHLKWPAKDQSLEHSSDEDWMWNKSLLKYIIPCAMNKLLHYAISLNEQAISLNEQDVISCEQVYAIFPSTATLKYQWLPLLERFKEKAMETSCLYSASTEKWIKPRDAYLIKRKDAKFQDTIKALLIKGKIPFCEPPSHVLDMLQESMQDVTSFIIRSEVIKQVSNLTKLQKQNLIQYFHHISKTKDLMNLELLELLDGTYRKFERSTPQNILYLETEECPRTLFPSGIENVIVSYNPGDEMYETMQKIAHSGETQLTILKPNDVSQLLQSVFNGIESYTPNSPPLCISEEWLERLWSFINKHNLNLAEFIGIPMMPLSSGNWESLSTSIPYIVDESTEWSLADIELSSEILERIGCKVVKEWNNVSGRISWQRIGSYASPPTVKGMIYALMKLKDKPNGGLFDKINNLNDNDKITLRNAIGNEKSELGLFQKNVLKELPLIRCYKTKDDLIESWSSLERIECLAELDYNIPLDYKIGKWKENEGFATKLGACNVSATVVLKKYIFPKLNKQFYEQSCIQEVMDQVLQNLHQHTMYDANFLQDVRNIPFLSTQNEKFMKPCEVIDPSDDHLKHLFQILDVFPCGKFSDRESLAKLGGIFRKVSEHDVLELIKYLNNSVNVTNQMCTQAEKLLQFLSDKGVIFLSKDTRSKICKMKWLPPKVDYPNYYPQKIGWFGKENVLYSPDNILSSAFEYVIGSVKPVLGTSLTVLDPGLVDVLKLNKLPSNECIVLHLENIRNVHTELEKKEKAQVTMLIREIYQMLSKSKQFTQVQRLLTNSESWIWNGDKFTNRAHVVLERAAVDTNPYVSCLPEEYIELSDFFLRLNVAKSVKLTDVLLMIHDYHQKKTATVEEKNRDLNKCRDILLALNDSGLKVPEETPLPIVSSDDTLEMASLENCAYCDQEMSKKMFDVDDVRDSLDEGEKLYVVHEVIPPLIAKGIGVPSLTSKYLDAEPIAYGQSEPLTQRLNRLLDDYKDGTSVFKELLQNADDAGASKVAFIYDCRDFRSSSTVLIDKNMKDLQGPALLCYNDAQFSDEDFANIAKLSGETKKVKLDKVGRFGLGFNAVYNLTDAPSFVSNHSIVILDPHVKYLGDAVKDATQPGIRLQFTKHGSKIRRFKDQFKPFENIMGVDIQNSQHYNGTLFRLPLRTPEQAQQSRISKKSYEKKDIQELFALFQKNAKNVLLFTQNVIEIDFYEIPNDSQQLVPSGHLEKSLVQLLHSVNRSMSNSTLNADWSNEMKILKHAHEVLLTDKTRRGSYIMKTQLEFNAGEMFGTGSSGLNYWLISTVVGNGDSRKLARQQKDLLPVGGIAVQLKQVENKYQPLSLKSEGKFDGQVFCFLPLPIKSELPFHINGYFAVESNRRQLCVQQFSEQGDHRAYWNEVLMKDSVKEAYVQSLCDMVTHKNLFPSLEKYILKIFPISVNKTFEGKINSIFTFTEAFYTSICERPFDILPSICTWMCFSNIKVLSPGLRNIVSKDLGNIGDMIFETCTNYFDGQRTNGFVDLPNNILDQMLCIDIIREVVESKIITLEEFYSSILLNSDAESEDDNFHKLIIYGLLESENKVDNILRNHKCIPVAGAKQLLLPTELVDQDGPLKDLYDEDCNPFPLWLKQNAHSKGIHANLRQKIRLALATLGMRVSDLPEEEIICQAKTVQFLSTEMGTKRSKCILELLNNKHINKADSFLESMKKVLFLPKAPKPQNWPFPWKNDHIDEEFILIDSAYSTQQSELIGCSELVACFPLYLASDLQKRLGYGIKEISFSQIEKQLDCIVPIVKTLGTQLFGNIEDIMEKIYYNLDSKAEEKPENCAYIKENYHTKELIMMKYTKYSVRKGLITTDTRLEFVTSQQCALTIHYDAKPYLFVLPYNFRHRHNSLVLALEIKDAFHVASLVQALKNIAQKENKLLEGGDTLPNVRNIVAMLAMKFPNEDITSFDMYGPVYLPDSSGIMTSSVNLCFNNCPWIKIADNNFLHESIPFGEAEKLGVKTVTTEMLSNHQYGIPFGQSEKLTNRIKRILDGYPCDKEIMNEILQNADDAGATEVHFILDPRTHAHEKLFDPMWEPLQGPALLVYNDKPFTDKDLEGIKNLGEGSKSKDPLTTGKYGVGFNCVYHLTDTPTFLTTVKGKGQTLVAFDPQCKYVPRSTPINPGQRWENVEKLQQNFPDVFECYQLPFETEGGTLFRFPLRAEGTESDISDNSMNAEKIIELFTTFSESIGEALLFVNNVKKVKLSTLDANGSIELIDKVELNMTGEHKQEKHRFDGAVQHAAKAIIVSNVANIQLTRTAYQVDIEHQNEVKKWLVVQQIGFESQSDFSNISDRYKKKKATMLPRGGVAYLLSPARINQPLDSKFTSFSMGNKDNKWEQQHRLFCFLPLPVKIPYPVHVNGYFVLEHESRRNIYHDENENGLNVMWNKLIMQKVVAPCYNKVMRYVKESIATPGELCDLKVKLKKLIDIFPHKKPEDIYMKDLERSIFEYMMLQKTEILPVLVRRAIWNNIEREPVSEIVDLHWYPICSDEKKIAYFDNLNSQLTPIEPIRTYGYSATSDRQQREQHQKEVKQRIKYIRNVLQNCRYPLTLADDTVLKKIQTYAGKSIQTAEHTSPENVMKFLVLNSGNFKLPVDVERSVFISRSALIDVFNFVKGCLHHCLENVPLLLKANSEVHIFKKRKTCILSDFCDLIESRSDLFADKMYLDSKIAGIDAYLKPLTCGNIAPILEYQLPKLKFYGKNKVMPLDLRQEQFIQWLIRFWSFIESQCKYDKSVDDDVESMQTKVDFERVKFMQEIKLLEEWCILPVKRNRYVYELWPLVDIFQLVNLGSGSEFGRDKYVVEILEKMSFPQVYIPYITNCSGDLSAMINIILRIVSDLSRPDRVLVAFGHAISKEQANFSSLNATDGLLILKYFSDSITILGESVVNAKSILRKLPLYETQSGDILSLENTQMTYYTMPDSVPTLIGWKPNNQNVYLKKHSLVDGLYKFIGISNLNAVDTYLHHILDFFPLLDDETRGKHLYFLKRLIEEPQQNLKPQHKQLLLNKMKSTPMLKNINGTLLTVSEYFDERVPVFNTFESNFPISPYNRFEWISFLRNIGLVHKLNGNFVLKYAKIVEEKAIKLGDYQHVNEDLWRKSNLLYETVMDDQKILYEIADSFKKIAFIPTANLPENLLALCSPHTEKRKFVKLDKSTLNRNKKVFWTQCPILVEWVHPSKDICDLLGIKRHVTLQEILSNLNAVIDVQIHSRILVSSVSQKLIEFLQATFRHITYNHREENMAALSKMRCIAVNKGARLVYPKQITFFFPSEEIEEHVTPYLFKIPLEFYEHHTLLIKIGATQKPTVEQYANVLRYIYDQIPNETLPGNEFHAAVYALRGLFDLAQDDNSISTLDQLHLLTDRHSLVYSQKLVFVDNPRFRERITNLDCSCFINEKKIGKPQVVLNALRNLNPKIKPVFLSEIVNECIDTSSEQLKKTVQCLDWEERFASKEFVHGIVRIMRNSDQDSFRSEKDDVKDIKLIQNLNIIKVFELDEVNTYLVHNGQQLPNSDEKLPYFIKNESEEIKILLSADSAATKSLSLSRTMCLIIDTLLRNKLEDKFAITLLSLILTCPIVAIEKVLDDEKVKPYEVDDENVKPYQVDDENEVDTNLQITKSGMPSPGQYIPLQFHHLLQQCIELLDVGEYVALEVSDLLDARIGEEIETNVDGDNETAVYCYARVMKILTTEGSYCNYYYEIDIGHDESEKTKVHASVLYRFERKQKTFSPPVVSTNADEDGQDAFNIPQAEGKSQIMSQIREKLEEAWKLKEEAKRKMVKRLFLQWHPDKNTEYVELSTEVFKFIQNEIDRLEKGQGSSEVDGTTGSRGGGGGWFYGFNFNQFFSGRARSYRHQRDQFEDDYRDHYSGRAFGSGASYYTPPRYQGKNPQPDEAKRWMRQAQHDLNAVRNDMGTNSNEWACFKAHQAAEKGLKATQFANDSGLKDNQHALPSLCNAIEDHECLTWACELEVLVKSSAAMRYPDRHYGGQTPHDAYSDSTAQTVKILASQILEKCQAYVISERQ